VFRKYFADKQIHASVDYKIIAKKLSVEGMCYVSAFLLQEQRTLVWRSKSRAFCSESWRIWM